MQEDVRCSVAAQLHQLYMLVGAADGRLKLLEPLKTLTRDSSPAVSLHALRALLVAVPRMAPMDVAVSRDVVTAVAAAAALHGGSRWRHAAAAAAAVPPLVDALHPTAASLLHDLLLPLALRMLESCVRAVLEPAAAALCAVLRRLPRERQRTEVCPKQLASTTHARLVFSALLRNGPRPCECVPYEKQKKSCE